jgi:hypothetical protein
MSKFTPRMVNWRCSGQWSKVLFFFGWIIFCPFPCFLISLLLLLPAYMNHSSPALMTLASYLVDETFSMDYFFSFAFGACLSFRYRRPSSISFDISMGSRYDLSPYLVPLCSRFIPSPFSLPPFPEAPHLLHLVS